MNGPFMLRTDFRRVFWTTSFSPQPHTSCFGKNRITGGLGNNETGDVSTDSRAKLLFKARQAAAPELEGFFLDRADRRAIGSAPH
jgi:hypothetical protein